MVYAQLRVDERTRTYVYASGANVAMTVMFTVLLVVFAGQGARGLLLGNFGASAMVVLGLWWVLRRRLSLSVHGPDLRAMLRFGLPTVPADASVYALQVADRFYLFRVSSHSAAGQYAVAIKLATVVFVAVRGFQYAWPPLAYSIESDEEAAELYSLVTTYYALATGVVVCAVALLGRWMVRLLAAHEYFGAYRRCRGWRSAGRCTACISCSWRSPGARASPRATSPPLRRACGQRRAAARARAAQRRRPGHRGRGDRAVRRLCGDAARDVPADAKPLQVGFEWRAGQLAGDPRRRGRLRRAVAADARPRGPRAARAVAGAGAGAAPARRASSTRTSSTRHVASWPTPPARDAFRAGHGEVEEYAEDPLKDI